MLDILIASLFACIIFKLIQFLINRLIVEHEIAMRDLHIEELLLDAREREQREQVKDYD